MALAAMNLKTAKEIARILGLNYRTVINKADSGQIPCYRFGSRRVFSVDEVLSKGREEQEEHVRQAVAVA